MKNLDYSRKKIIGLVLITLGLTSLIMFGLQYSVESKLSGIIKDVETEEIVNDTDTIDWDVMNEQFNPYRLISFNYKTISFFMVEISNEDISELKRIFSVADKFDSVCINNEIKFTTRMIENSFNGKYSFRYEFEGAKSNIRICEPQEPTPNTACRRYGIVVGLQKGKYLDILTTIRDKFFLDVIDYQESLKVTDSLFNAIQ